MVILPLIHIRLLHGLKSTKKGKCFLQTAINFQFPLVQKCCFTRSISASNALLLLIGLRIFHYASSPSIFPSAADPLDIPHSKSFCVHILWSKWRLPSHRPFFFTYPEENLPYPRLSSFLCSPLLTRLSSSFIHNAKRLTSQQSVHYITPPAISDGLGDFAPKCAGPANRQIYMEI